MSTLQKNIDRPKLKFKVYTNRKLQLKLKHFPLFEELDESSMNRKKWQFIIILLFYVGFYFFFFSIFVVCLFVLLQFALHWISSVSVHLTSSKWFLYTTNEKPNFQMKVHLGRWKYSNRGNSIVIDELTFFFSSIQI